MGDAPHPRILFESVPDPVLLAELSAFAATPGVVGEDVTSVHASDWDLVVSFRAQPEEPRGVHVLSFGGNRFSDMYVAGGVRLQPRRDRPLMARTVFTAAELGSRMRSLVDRSIAQQDPGPGRLGLDGLPPKHVPLAVVGAEKIPWAAVFSRDQTLVWALPRETTQHVEWLVLVLEKLHDVDAVRFPGSPDWQRSMKWGTPEVRVAIAELETTEHERAEALAKFDERAAVASERLNRASQAAADGAQRVLTATGSELENAVQILLEDLGYDVLHMDEHHSATSGGNLEDLRVSTPDGRWVCLVEIKGYTKGAKVNDVPRITGRPSVVYAATEGKAPDAVWHVVNGWIAVDPATREVAIPNDHDLAVLTDANGCLIDTRDLFRAWRDVREGRARAEDVRASMTSSRTRWTWPDSGSGGEVERHSEERPPL